MHEEKIALVRRQIEALAAAVASRNIRHVWLALPLIEQKYHFVQLLPMRPKTASGLF